MKNFYTIRQNTATNLLLLFMCVLLLGFVYLNSKVIDQFYLNKAEAEAQYELIVPNEK
jgi:hypothetical protein